MRIEIQIMKNKLYEHKNMKIKFCTEVNLLQGPPYTPTILLCVARMARRAELPQLQE